MAAWHYVGLPKEIQEKITANKKGTYGMIPIIATIGKTSWETSLLPMGNSTYFIALKKQIRKKEDVQFQDSITISFIVR